MRKSWLEVLAGFIGMLLFAAMFNVVIVNWFMGCGEVMYFPDGSWKTGECWLIPYEPVSGQN